MGFLFVTTKFYNTLKGPNEFQVIVFYPKTTTVRAAKHLYICDSCRQDYDSCSLFQNYDLVVENLNKINLQSNYDHKNINDGVERDEETTYHNYILLPVSVCVIAADNKSIDAVWFVQIIGKFNSPENVIDDYGHTASTGEKYMLGQFLEQVHDQITREKYKLMHKKKMIFYRESIVYPFVNMSEINGLCIISSRDFLSHYQELGCFKHEYPLYSMTTIIHQIITLKKLPNSKTTKIHSKQKKIFHLIIFS